MSAQRIDAVRKLCQKCNLDGFIVTNMDQVRYLTGFTGSAGLLVVAGKKAQFLTDFRYTDQSRKEVKGAKVSIVKSGLISSLGDYPAFNAANRRYGFSAEYTTVGLLASLQAALSDCLLVEADGLFTELGWVKEKSEIESVQKAVDISDIAFERILNLIAPGVRERELAAELEYQMMMLGSEKIAFESIVASGYRSAMPHGAASSKKLKKGDFVTFDFGATVNGYVSDITRTVVVGKATSRQKKVYQTVFKAQAAAIRKMKPGVLGKTVDAAARNLITKAGYGKNFGHGTGHGIGVIVHTGPRLSPISEDKMKVGNIVTVEPGIYISGWGGVRIEDDILVTRSGHRVMNQAPKKLLEL